ncbi:Uncharacterised protein [Paucimonas lemoignei]|nr:Uncharacterised protein [Paucimonas lemoignei]
MDIHAFYLSDLAALAITRIVDGRCNSLENPGITIHPDLTLFGRGPADTKVFLLDDGVLQGTTLSMSRGAWLIRLDVTSGPHSFSVYTSDGAVSASWEITVEALTTVCLPTVDWTSRHNVRRFK